MIQWFINRTMVSKTLILYLFYMVDITINLVLAIPISTGKSLSMCDLVVNNAGTKKQLICNVKKGQTLDYRDVRAWSAKEVQGKYFVQITCTGGRLFLSWPFKAKNVESLEVQDCLIEGFLAEMTTKQTVADELQSLVLARTSIEIGLSEMYDLRNNINKISQDTDCGQLTLVNLVLRDVHYDVKASPEERDGLVHMHTNSPMHAKIPHETTQQKCIYPNLKYVDESGSRKSGQYYLKLLPGYSYFPKLEIYNMSRNELSHVPEFFRHLQTDKFPSLRLIDFSNNFLRSFEFELPVDMKLSYLEVIDLHGNDIAALSPVTTKKLENLGSVFVDLRENPLHCSCRLKDLQQYFENQYRGTMDVTIRQRVTDITCMQAVLPYGTFNRINLMDVIFDKKCQV